MPLIILSGLPTSGKSTRAKQLYDYLAERIEAEATKGTEGTAAPATPKYRLHLISDDALSISRAVYDLSTLPAHTRSANASEKDARASIYGAVKRVLSPRDIVVLDGLNYIKGWRYQLACEAKNVSTTSAVLQIGCSVERARQNNETRLQDSASPGAAEPYSVPNWDNLVFRYEEPNPMTRWDSPLFALTWDDDATQTRAVFDKLWDAVAGAGRKEVQPNKVTVQRGNDGGGDFLYVLDRETQDVVKRILDAQKEPAGGNSDVRIPWGGSGNGSNGDDFVVELPGKVVGLPQLQRLRRAYMGLNRGGIGLEGAGGQLTGARIRESFVGYLNDAFEKEG